MLLIRVNTSNDNNNNRKLIVNSINRMVESKKHIDIEIKILIRNIHNILRIKMAIFSKISQKFYINLSICRPIRLHSYRTFWVKVTFLLPILLYAASVCALPTKTYLSTLQILINKKFKMAISTTRIVT